MRINQTLNEWLPCLRYPATYLHGAALSSGWAVANCVSSYGGELLKCSQLYFPLHLKNVVCSSLRLREGHISGHPVAAGILGPWLIGEAKTKFGGFTAPMLIMALLSFFGVLYFAVLLRFLPAKERESDNEAAALL